MLFFDRVCFGPSVRRRYALIKKDGQIKTAIDYYLMFCVFWVVPKAIPKKHEKIMTDTKKEYLLNQNYRKEGAIYIGTPYSSSRRFEINESEIIPFVMHDGEPLPIGKTSKSLEQINPQTIIGVHMNKLGVFFLNTLREHQILSEEDAEWLEKLGQD